MSGDLILASGSPRRSELLKLAGYDFSVIPADCEERFDSSLSPKNAVMALAEQKALHISVKYPDKTVIGADTTVFCENRPLGKPKNVKDAAEMLKMLSGRVHKVITAVAIAKEEKTEKLFAEETEVEFYPLSDFEIDEYIKTGEPMDKAGAYGIQGKGALLIKGIKGDYYNVMGLPVARLSRELNALLPR